MQVLGKALLLRNNTKRGGMGIHREGVRILALLALVSVAVAVALLDTFSVAWCAAVQAWREKSTALPMGAL